jgi:hypothetical protein
MLYLTSAVEGVKEGLSQIAFLMTFKASPIGAASCRARVVGTMRGPSLSNKGSPKVFLRRARRLLIAGWLKRARQAAPLTLLSMTKASNAHEQVQIQFSYIHSVNMPHGYYPCQEDYCAMVVLPAVFRLAGSSNWRCYGIDF